MSPEIALTRAPRATPSVRWWFAPAGLRITDLLRCDQTPARSAFAKIRHPCRQFERHQMLRSEVQPVNLLEFAD